MHAYVQDPAHEDRRGVILHYNPCAYDDGDDRICRVAWRDSDGAYDYASPEEIKLGDLKDAGRILDEFVKDMPGMSDLLATVTGKDWCVGCQFILMCSSWHCFIYATSVMAALASAQRLKMA